MKVFLSLTVACLVLMFGMIMLSPVEQPQVKVLPESTVEVIDRLTYWQQYPEESPLSTASDARNLAMVAESINSVVEADYGISLDDNCLTSIMQCVINRVNTPGFPNTIVEVCCQKYQWQGYSEDIQPEYHTVRLAKDLLELQGECYIATIPGNCVYFCLTPQGIEYRSTWDGTDTTLVKFVENFQIS